MTESLDEEFPGEQYGPGDMFTYSHPEGKGYGEHHLGEPLTAEMKELDLHDGDQVVILELDADSGWPIIQWTDTHGLNRLTTIDPTIFNDYFKPVV